MPTNSFQALTTFTSTYLYPNVNLQTFCCWDPGPNIPDSVEDSACCSWTGANVHDDGEGSLQLYRSKDLT